MDSFDSLPDDDQYLFLVYLREMRVQIERLKFLELVDAPEAEKKEEWEEYEILRANIIGMLEDFEAQSD